MTWATSVPILRLPRPLCSRLMPDIHDRQTVRRQSGDRRQTDRRQTALSLNAPHRRAGIKISRSPNFRFYSFFLNNLKPYVSTLNFRFLVIFFTCVHNLIQIIFRYELRFAAFIWPNLCFWIVILCPAFVR